ncbi:Uncharacterised protein g1504 [Pycnogonum litorale]
MKGCIVVLIGLPASGKSTLCNELRNKLLSGPTGVIYVCFDELLLNFSQSLCLYEKAENSEASVWKKQRQEILDRCDKLVEEIFHGHFETDSAVETSTEKFSETSVNVYKLVDQLHSVVGKSSFVMLIDDNMYYRSMRYEWLNLSRKHGLGFCQIYVQCSVEDCIARNIHRSADSKVDNNVIRRMAVKLEEPECEKKHWEDLSFFVRTEQSMQPDKIQCIHDFIMDALDKPIKPLKDNTECQIKSRNINTTNLIHRSDNMLRKIVGEKIRSVFGSNGRLLNSSYKDLNQKRIEVLEKLKNEKFLVPICDEKHLPSDDELNDFLIRCFDSIK